MSWQHEYRPVICHVPLEPDPKNKRWGYGENRLWVIPVHRAKPMVVHWSCASRQWAMWSQRCVWDGDGWGLGRWSIPDGERWVQLVVTLCLWYCGKHRTAKLLLLARAHYPISSEVIHWGRLVLSPLSLTLWFLGDDSLLCLFSACSSSYPALTISRRRIK